MGGRCLLARHLKNVVFDFGGLPLRPWRVTAVNLGNLSDALPPLWHSKRGRFLKYLVKSDCYGLFLTRIRDLREILGLEMVRWLSPQPMLYVLHFRCLTPRG